MGEIQLMADEPVETPLCWQCERYVVEVDGDFCDLCLDDVAAELEARLARGQR